MRPRTPREAAAAGRARRARRWPRPARRRAARCRPGSGRAAASAISRRTPSGLDAPAPARRAAAWRAAGGSLRPSSPTVRRSSRRRAGDVGAARPASRRPVSVLATAGRAGGQQLGEQPQLGGAVGVERAVVVEMVARQVGEPRRREPHPVEPELVEPVRGGLDRRVLHAGARPARPGSRRAPPGRAWSGRGRRRSRARSGRACRGWRRRWPASAQSWRRNSTVLVLPLVPVTATTVAGCAAGERRGELGEARRGSGSSISGRGGTPGGQLGAGRRQHGGGAARDRLGDEGAAVRARRPGRAANRIAGRDLAAVGGDAGDVQLPARAPGGGPAAAGRRWSGTAAIMSASRNWRDRVDGAAGSASVERPRAADRAWRGPAARDAGARARLRAGASGRAWPGRRSRRRRARARSRGRTPAGRPAAAEWRAPAGSPPRRRVSGSMPSIGPMRAITRPAAGARDPAGGRVAVGAGVARAARPASSRRRSAARSSGTRS